MPTSRSSAEEGGRGGREARRRTPGRALRRAPHACRPLARIAAADALVQTSIGFETVGMTPFEAATLGTPSIISDPDIAAELGAGFWAVADADGAGAGARRGARRDAAGRGIRYLGRHGTHPLPAVAEAFASRRAPPR